MPMKHVNVPKFERHNILSIDVYSYGDGSLSCCCLTKYKTAAGKIELLLLTEENNSHYCLITNFQTFNHRVCRSKKKAEKGPKAKICSNCMHFVIKSGYTRHVKLCETNRPLDVSRPSNGSKTQFSNWQKTQKFSFVVNADLEAINVAVNEPQTSKNTENIERQYPASYGAVLVNSKSKFHLNTIFFGFSKAHHTFLVFLAIKVMFESFYRGQDSIEKLINCLQKWLGWCESQQQNYRKLLSVMSWSKRQQLLSTENPICCLCQEHVSHKKEMVFSSLSLFWSSLRDRAF